MYLRVAQRLTLRTAIALTICIGLLPTPGLSLLISGEAQGQREERKGKPKPGKPEGVWPDLEKAKQQSQIEREAPPPIPSTIRSKKNSGKPWDGRRVGDPAPPNGTERGSAGSALAANNQRISERRNSQTRRAHARARMTLPPPPHDQFVSNFFTYALVRSPNSEETTYWYDQLRVAYANSSTALKLAGIELGRTLFESAEYAARNRDAHWYVYDLYKTYLMRDPDAGGWAMWEGLVPTHGREYVRRGFEESGEFATLSANITTSGAPSSNAASLISARVDARNQPGRGMLSRDANWSVPLLSLPGRASLDLGLALSYSSMVWTRSGPYIYFDEDNGFPSPGFRLGFPTVQRKVFDTQTAKPAYLMITAAGRRVELRHVSSNIYDAADSSYLRLTEDGAVLRVHSTDGTRLTFSEANGEYRCTEIKDRNGNYLTVSYNTLGQITTITDTLGRVITFSYDSNSNPISITQMWGTQTHTWATFGWISHTMQTSFGTLRVVGTANNAVLPLLKQVGLPDGDRYQFEYTNAAQVQVIRRFRADDTQPFYNVFQYESTTTDAPRLEQTRVAAENWTSLNGVPGEVTTNFAVDPDGACRMTAPDGTVYKEYYGTGWQKGLTTLSEVWSGEVKQKWTTTAWTQDNTAVSYELNPRVTETNVYDAGGNRRRTVIDYGIYAQWGLPYDVKDYAADGTTEIRHTYYDYNLSQAYLDRRIIGLVHAIHQTNVTSWQRKIGYTYDDPTRLESVPAAATQHDATYNTSFTARGNLTAVSRWDVEDIVNPAKALTSHINYYTTGTTKSTTDPGGHQSSITYADSFSDNGNNRNTFAYPTTITDADGFSSSVQYNFDFGGTTRTEGPPPVAEQPGAIQTISYDSIGRVERTTTVNNDAYTRYFYGANYVQSYSTVNNVADDAYNIQYFDGVGRVIATAGNHPGSTAGYRAQMMIYDLMGRVVKTSNPAEITAQWAPAGDDDAGWLYTEQTYDWQGRPLRTTHPDTTYREASYSGCGCAGGEVVTLTDEGTLDAGEARRRQQKIYSDVLGRAVKTETLNWQNGSVYSATVNTYNARDEVTQVRQYAGAEGSGTHQDTTMTYDGYGRLKTRHVPEHNAGTATTWVYKSDDTIESITDARGASSTFTYNNARHLPNIVTHTLSGSSTIVESFAYDGAGNRTSMSDTAGSTSYQYNQLSQITSETRTFTGLAGSYMLSYEYNLAGQLKSLTDHTNQKVNYAYDTAGRLSTLTGTNYSFNQFINSHSYRAWGAPKQVTYGNGRTITLNYNSRLQPTHFEIAGSSSAMSIDYQYYDDGRVKYSQNLLDGRLDRKYEYDHAARLVKALSGAEARGEPATTNRPYKQTAGYDAFGHLTTRSTLHWSRTLGFGSNDSYTNNRRNGWTYDANGNLLNPLSRQYTYDAAGRIKSLTWTGGFLNQFFDGGGQRVKSTEPNIVNYYLRSTVLGGQVIAQLDGSGVRELGFIYINGELIGRQSANGVVSLLHKEPSGVSERAIGQSGLIAEKTELDPWGAEVYAWDPYPADPGFTGGRAEGGPVHPGFGNVGLPSTGCTADGLFIPCDMADRLLGQGAAVEGPRNTTRYDWKTKRFEFFRAFADGYSGYLPANARYQGGGIAKRFSHYGRVGLTVGELEHKSWRWIPVFETYELSPEPQETLTPLSAKDIYSIYRNIKNIGRHFPGCSNFIKGTLEKLKELNPNNPPVSTDMLKIFRLIQNQSNGGFFSSNKGASTIRGLIKNGDAKIIYVSSPYIYVSRTIHEGFHLSGSNGWFYDQQVAQAISQVDESYLKEYEGIDPMDKGAYYRYSYLIDNALSKNCPNKPFQR